jgi:N-acetyl-1-D-myo-inositol-2-amino-2-deoxy-alpha-D-glucopyranoside deacetylase
LGVGVVTGFLGTVAHLGTAPAGDATWPAGLGLAVLLAVAADVALAVSTRSAVAMLGAAAGRALVVGVTAAPGPGGDLLLLGVWASEVWALVAVLLPALAAPSMSTWAAVRRVRDAHRSTSTGPGTPAPEPAAPVPAPGNLGR